MCVTPTCEGSADTRILTTQNFACKTGPASRFPHRVFALDTHIFTKWLHRRFLRLRLARGRRGSVRSTKYCRVWRFRRTSPSKAQRYKTKGVRAQSFRRKVKAAILPPLFLQDTLPPQFSNQERSGLARKWSGFSSPHSSNREVYQLPLIGVHGSGSERSTHKIEHVGKWGQLINRGNTCGCTLGCQAWAKARSLFGIWIVPALRWSFTYLWLRF